MRQHITWGQYEALCVEAAESGKVLPSIAEQVAAFICSKGHEGCSEELAVTSVSHMTDVPVIEIYRHWTADIVPVLRGVYGCAFNSTTCRWCVRTKRTRIIPTKSENCSVHTSA